MGAGVTGGCFLPPSGDGGFALLDDDPIAAAVTKPSAMGASASSRSESAAERRVALLALEGANDGSADTDGVKLGLDDG